jgi:hypothetical protein
MMEYLLSLPPSVEVPSFDVSEATKVMSMTPRLTARKGVRNNEEHIRRLQTIKAKASIKSDLRKYVESKKKSDDMSSPKQEAMFDAAADNLTVTSPKLPTNTVEKRQLFRNKTTRGILPTSPSTSTGALTVSPRAVDFKEKEKSKSSDNVKEILKEKEKSSEIKDKDAKAEVINSPKVEKDSDKQKEKDGKNKEKVKETEKDIEKGKEKEKEKKVSYKAEEKEQQQDKEKEKDNEKDKEKDKYGAKDSKKGSAKSARASLNLKAATQPLIVKAEVVDSDSENQ